jgi:serine/threonine-protein kinase
MGTTPVRVGDVIAEKYVVDSILGEGGMGVVVAARHMQLEQRVAIKFLLPEIALQGMAAERFRREARSAARIRGEHVCRVLDVGTLKDGVPYMVMEYLEGCDLAAELERRGRLPSEEAVEYVLQACEALAEAHMAGVVHRDLKPANLFLAARADGSRRVKVLDFGVSKSLLSSDSGQMSLTTTATFVGSPFYMSPEQLDSAKDVDARTDIWALGVVLYELLTGRTPFAGESIPRLVAAVLHDVPPPLASLGVDVPEGLEAAILRALQKVRNERFTSVGEFADSIALYAPPHAAVSAARVARVLAGGVATPTGASRMPAQPASSGSSVKRPATPLSWMKAGAAAEKSKRRRREIALALMLVLSLVGFAVYRLSEGPEPARSTAGHEHVVSIPQPPPVPNKAPEPAPVAAQPAPAPEALPSGVAAPTGAAVLDSPSALKPRLEAQAPAASTSAPEAAAATKPPLPATHPSSSHAKPRHESAPASAAPAPSEKARRSGNTLTDFGGRR